MNGIYGRHWVWLSTLLAAVWVGAAPTVRGHDLSDGAAHPHYRVGAKPPLVVAPGGELAQAGTAPTTPAPAQARPFAAFAPKVRTHWDADYLYVEHDGLPAHAMMVGITAWQQQVPLPQPYRGANAWRIPLVPQPAEQPRTIRNQFLRGAIAIAANGIPIFNPQNNRGEISQEIGELDEFGGHCGRADDYHYHAAPLHLQTLVGASLPIAFALDGYAIYGLTEPDGVVPADLDVCHGHATPALGYHYHASKQYPYVNGGFHGRVVERDGQVDPQPRARGVRPAQAPLRGARITGFTMAADQTTFSLGYTVNGRPGKVGYATNAAGGWTFDLVDPQGVARRENYGAGELRGGGGGGGGRREGPPPPRVDRAPGPVAAAQTPLPRTRRLRLTSPAVAADGRLPVEFTGDGAGISPPLEWSGAPPDTQAYAVIMHHIDPEGVVKWYWTLYNLPAEVHALPKNAQGVGTLGNNSVTRRPGYAPPHSKGPGPKTYVLTLYALSAFLTPSVPPSQVNREVLLAAMQGRILESTEMKVVCDRTAALGGSGQPGPTP